MSHRSCKQAAILLTRSVDGSLGWFGRLRLALHLRVCSTCPNVYRQLLFLRQAARDGEQSEDSGPQTPALQEQIKEALRRQERAS